MLLWPCWCCRLQLRATPRGPVSGWMRGVVIINTEIQEALERDLPNILSLYSQFEIDNGQVLPLEQARAVFRKMKSYPDYKVYVALYQGEVVGTFALLIMDNLAHMGAPSGIVEDVVVKEKYQGQGIGKQMMRFAL